MSEFTLPDMSCGHCVASITKAVQALDAQAKLQFDLPSHKVQVESQLSQAALVAALTEAGYPPAN
ncbi:heavy-metal-associated domain-containing protein [Paucibacter sediminis]|uniref:Heavy-metal-associated domain-containing protein n=1 Tax=Paucibacter sediminis TaxID=3019553 RepID=A0AA95NED9_9BURK|nr:heavy-metal-associated domain-containing protein [Paucibacter sp. S2-9]WIT12670.1 heavy-metal-associated domain-containing protein [Paucibacter sp. S2-9]